MMASNKTIATLLIVAMVLSLFGMVLSLNRIEGISKLAALTGAWDEGATTYGKVNISITSQLSINFSDDNATIGDGYVRGGEAQCEVGTDMTNTTGCVDFIPSNGLILENTGNTAAEVNLSNVNYTTSFFTSADAGGYAMKFEMPESGSGSVSGTCNISGLGLTGALTLGDFNNTWVNITSSNYPGSPGGTGRMLCSFFNATDAEDTINISFKFMIANSQPATADMADLFTATATTASTTA